MNLRLFESASSFYEVTQGVLLAHEAENSLMLGVILRLLDGHRYGEEEPFLSCVEDRGRVIAMATRTPPHGLLVWTAGNSRDPLPSIIEGLTNQAETLPGVHGRVRVVEGFAALWSRRTGRTASGGMAQRLYRLTTVRHPVGVHGQARWAVPADAELLSLWARAFADEAVPGDPKGDTRALVDRAIQGKRLLIWDDGGVVSMAAASRPTPNGCSISLVYTPPERRRLGYASGCVAELSQRLLDSGKSFCTLFADLDNPTSNAIYQRMGFQPLADFREIRFAPARSVRPDRTS
jgi:predicted GNAT family acetyltransferase